MEHVMPHKKVCNSNCVQFELCNSFYKYKITFDPIWPSFDPSAQPYTLIPHFFNSQKEHRQFCLFRLRFKNQLEFNKYDLKTKSLMKISDARDNWTEAGLKGYRVSLFY